MYAALARLARRPHLQFCCEQLHLVRHLLGLRQACANQQLCFLHLLPELQLPHACARFRRNLGGAAPFPVLHA